jgi:hypothetical protein
MRKARDDHVLRIPGDGCGAADIARRSESEQKRNRIRLHHLGSVDQQRRQRKTHDVIDEKCGQHSRHHHRHRKHPVARLRPLENCPRKPRESARQPQVRDHDHHPEQQRERIVVDRLRSLPFVDHPEHDHRHRARQCRAGAIDAQVGNLTRTENEIGQGKDGYRDGVVGGHWHSMLIAP